MKNSDLELSRLAARVGRRLLARRLFVTTAESCTGGWIAKALTDVAGSSQWFSEGFVTYSNKSKMRRLGAPRRRVEEGGRRQRSHRASDGEGSPPALGRASRGGGHRDRGTGRRGAG